MTTPPPPTTTTVLHCYNHPNVETSLRCRRCEKPICPKCAVLTPTGYKCKDCVRGQQKAFETSQGIDYPIAFIVAAILSYIGSYSTLMGFFTILLAPLAGGIIAEAIRFAIRRHRSKRLYQVAAAGALVGSLPPLLMLGLTALLMMSQSIGFRQFFDLYSLIWHVVYAGIVTTTVYYRLGGINMKY